MGISFSFNLTFVAEFAVMMNVARITFEMATVVMLAPLGHATATESGKVTYKQTNLCVDNK
jgi:hypothetical protein